MKKLIMGAVLSLFSVLAHAEIQVQVEPSQITRGEPFKLSLIQDDPQNHGVPDLTVLQKDFVILGTERNVSYSIINGQAQSSSQWIVALKAKKTGVLTIPAIKIGLEQSTPFTVNVVEGTSTQSTQPQVNANQSQDVFLTTEVKEKKAYVNQQITYTIKLYTANDTQLLNGNYQDPRVDDALLISLGDTKRYPVVQNGTNYFVEEQSYAIFPQKSGTLKIKSPVFTALVYDLVPQRVQAQDKAINVTVQPIPAQYTGKIWLPAKQIKLTEHYENPSQTISQGSTLTRIVTIEGTGIPAELLPSLKFEEANAFSVYPEKGADKNQVNQGEIIGSTEIKVTYLFNKVGKAIIPELRLPWFNTETGKEEVAILAPRTLEITPATTGVVNNEKPKAANKEVVVKQPPAEASSSSQANNWGWVAAAAFALAWIITLGLWGWQRRSRKLGKGQYKHALDELERACSEGNPARARDALLKWASLHWPDAPLLNLTDLTKLVIDAHLKKQLHLLSQVLYRQEDGILWRGDELLRAVQSMKRTQSNVKRKSQVLPPINPF
ncbi:BatD family protein [Legionella fallonii]|uniref:DUF7939 domain-containing protein n=1 Tax=Legionella fallonii LLAP-10 TaxID=1212491 RepID=A0A098G8W1_9GAMM|nr:BatD family protein [Legionella fallonii]CEG58913.1 conserved exported protein of unknown function [Legionella fallonii LLAP-10]